MLGRLAYAEYSATAKLNLISLMMVNKLPLFVVFKNLNMILSVANSSVLWRTRRETSSENLQSVLDLNPYQRRINQFVANSDTAGAVQA